MFGMHFTPLRSVPLYHGSETWLWRQFCKALRCLNTDVFVLLVEYGHRISSVTQMLGVSGWSLGSEIRRDTEREIKLVGAHFCAWPQNAWLTVCYSSRKMVAGKWVEMTIRWHGEKLWETIANWLTRVGAVSPPSWSPRDPLNNGLSSWSHEMTT